MAPKPQALLLLLLLPLLLLSPVTANDILGILKPFNDYSTFTQYLIEANLVDEINNRDSVTVLAVKNSEISPISSLPTEVRKNVMSVHVLLGYYDPYSITHLHDKTTVVPTLFQSTGLATDQIGYMKVSKKPMRQIVFGSDVPGSPSDAYLISVVGSNSDKMSVVHISNPIIPPGIDSIKETSTPVATPPATSSPTKQMTPVSTATPPAASPPTKEVTPAPVATSPTTSQQVTPAPVATQPATSPPAKQVTTATPPADSSPTKQVTTTTPPTASPPTKQETTATSPTTSSPTKHVTPAPALAPTEKKAATAPTNAPKASASAPSIENVPEAPANSIEEAGEAPTSPSSAGRVVMGAGIGLAIGVVLLGAC